MIDLLIADRGNHPSKRRVPIRQPNDLIIHVRVDGTLDRLGTSQDYVATE